MIYPRFHSFSVLFFCLFAVLLWGCTKDKSTTDEAKATPEVKELQRIRPAAGHFMMDYMPDAIPPTSMNLPDSIAQPVWVRNAAPFIKNSDRPKIVVVIDDLGLSHKKAELVASLPAPLTLAYLPYARNLEEQTELAMSRGHELMVHMPMQPISDKADPGPDALIKGVEPEDLLRRVEKNLGVFDGYVGINNHMGSGFTQDQAGLDVLMKALQERGLMYLDSRTSAGSLAETTARRYNVATTGRDVFIDHKITEEFITEALLKTEDIARRRGSAIAIGHPHEMTVAALAAWLPTLERKGFQLVPITSVIEERDPRVHAALVESVAGL
ncbi:MAG: divergent polysaccharide deacetylase family protein [Pseudomonadota bacterium]